MRQRIKVTQKDRSRTRFIYLLGFADGSCYVGQTTSPKDRKAQHVQLWQRPLTLTVVDQVEGTYRDAEELEYAWRLAASRRGHRVYGEPGILVQPGLRTTPYREQLASRLTWQAPRNPTTQASSGWGVAWKVVAGLLALAVAAHALGL